MSAPTAARTIHFTDRVGSTRLKETLGDAAAIEVLEAHRARVRALPADFPDAREIKTIGDAFLLTFARPSDAVRFASSW